MDSKVRSLDFSQLTLRDALDLAILIEEEAKDRYEEFAHQMEIHHNEEAARFFHFMQKNEAHHEAELAQRRERMFKNAPSMVRREMIFDIEAPEYDEARAFMTPHEALASVMRSEVKAHDFFDAALSHVQDPEVRALFEELKKEELQHQELVRKEQEKLPPESKIRTEDFADEPVSH